jgi:hypothetical protein
VPFDDDALLGTSIGTYAYVEDRRLAVAVYWQTSDLKLVSKVWWSTRPRWVNREYCISWLDLRLRSFAEAKRNGLEDTDFITL